MSKLARFAVLLFTLGISAWFLYPSVRWYYFIPATEKEFLNLSQDQLDTQTDEIKKKVIELKKIKKGALNLGLDLQGGVNISLAVDDTDLKSQLLTKNKGDSNKAFENFTKEYDESVDRVVEVLKNRMDTFGVSEPTIRKTFGKTVSIELPGLDNPQLVKEALSKVGKLEFRIVDEKTMELLKLSNSSVRQKGYVTSRSDVPQDFPIPETSEWVSYYENDEFGIPHISGWYVLLKKVELEGTNVRNARHDFDNYGRPKVSFELDSHGARVFADVTKKNIKKRLAIVLDGKVKSAPNIAGEIAGGYGEITGSFTVDETVFLANVLKSGSLPVKLNIVEEKVIGPTLGADSISEGTTAALYGTAIVMLFMVIYYRLSGVIAIIALLFNMTYLIALLAGISATLTLSGIAGIALTVGMAVDANVIIYERIREELRRSKVYKHALDNGFLHASATIWDSNLTTLIAAFALYIFGSGTIKGFGITLTFGIMANIFAALFVSRLVFDFFVETLKFKKVSV